MRRKISTLRHWKQRFNKNADFIWRKAVKWQGKIVKPGKSVPDELVYHPRVLKEIKSSPDEHAEKLRIERRGTNPKIRRFWEAGIIELAEFEAPDVLTGRVKEKPYRNLGGGWYEVDTPDGPVKVRSKARLEERLASLKE